MSSNNLAKNRFNMIVLILMSCAYFLLFIVPNLTGAKDANMLVAFKFDEWMQFRYLREMTTLGASPYETLKNMVFYKHYFYGYPHYLISVVSILPLKFIFKSVYSINDTTAYMFVLRQLSPFFMLIAVNLLIYLWTGFKSLKRSIFLFIFLNSVPAIFNNNMLWHPDSLVTLFVVLTIFSLSKDELSFGKWFYLAAVFCGLATGTKLIGLYFFLTVAVYLVLGLVNGKITLRNLLKHGSLFFFVMVLTVVITNPLLLLPKMAKIIFGKLSWQARMNEFGWGIQMEKGLSPWYKEVLENSFGF